MDELDVVSDECKLPLAVRDAGADVGAGAAVVVGVPVVGVVAAAATAVIVFRNFNFPPQNPQIRKQAYPNCYINLAEAGTSRFYVINTLYNVPGVFFVCAWGVGRFE